jgi:hypothetical protein
VLWPVTIAAAMLGPRLPSLAAWSAGLAGGAALVMWLWLRESPPDYVDRWRRGAEGEVSTARELARLGPEWRVRHDVRSKHGNFDHLVAGPGGVFVLDSKNFAGTAQVRGSKVLVTRGHLPNEHYKRELGRWVLGQGHEIHSRLTDELGRAPWVQGVVVFTNDFPQGLVETSRVVYVHRDRLVAWLQERPRRLERHECAHIWGAIEQMPDAEAVDAA